MSKTFPDQAGYLLRLEMLLDDQSHRGDINLWRFPDEIDAHPAGWIGEN